MTDQKILEAIQKILRGTHYRDWLYRFEPLSKEILSAIKPLLPPTDLVKVWEGVTKCLIGETVESEFDIKDFEKHLHIEIYIREVK